MKKINYLTLALFTFAATAAATVWTDDFESYPVGYDIANSADWGDEFSEGTLLIGQDGGNKYVYDGGGFVAAYDFQPPGEVDNSEISFDYLFTGSDTFATALYRLAETTYPDPRGFAVSLMNDYNGSHGFGDYVMAGYFFNDNGVGFTWYEPNIFFLNQTFTEDIWYHVDAALYGGLYPYFSVDITDVGNYTGRIDAIQLNHQGGFCGLSIRTVSGGTTWVDNFTADDDPVITGIKSASLGEIKASFR